MGQDENNKAPVASPRDEATLVDSTPAAAPRLDPDAIFNAIKPGMTLGGFRTERLLGKGAMGEVWLARQLSMDRDIALKILPAHLAMDRNYVNRFLREVKVAAKLEHAHIVTAYEAGEDSNVLYLALALVNGETVADCLKRDGMFSEKDALRITRQIAEALSYAWDDHKLLHRDVKPANIMLDQRGNAKLMDLGISKCLQEGMELTVTDMVMGTPNYMSPEQLEGKGDLDFRSDLYSLGMTLYQMLTGQVPFKSSSVIETLRKQAIEHLPSVKSYNTTISDGCLDLLERMLAKQREKRHASWVALIADIDSVRAGSKPNNAALKAGESIMIRAHELQKDPPPPSSQAKPPVAAQKKAEARRKRRSPVGRMLRWAVVLGAIGYVSFRTYRDPVWRDNLIDTTNRFVQQAKILIQDLKQETTGEQTANTTTPHETTERKTPTAEQNKTGPDPRANSAHKDLKSALAEIKKQVPDLKADQRSAPGGINLSLENNLTLQNIAPLANQPLVELDLSRTAVGDISILATMPLRRLDLSNTRIADFKPLSGIRTLKVLELRDTSFRDLALLANMDSLHSLAISGCPVNDITPMRNLTRLTDLELGRNALANLDRLPLCCLRLETLRLSANHGLPITANLLRQFPALKHVIINTRPMTVEQAAALFH